VQYFLGEDYVVSDLSSFDVASLLLRNDRGEDGFKSVSHQFGKDFIEDIAKGYGAELVRGVSLV